MTTDDSVKLPRWCTILDNLLEEIRQEIAEEERGKSRRQTREARTATQRAKTRV